ncbi:DUF4870 domain-containing protein [Cellulomonas sp. P22]|uniref:DUF4870 domain-containing protein n=1 Tax=Cellulomonas sp. P22 TaxID=3373189 RepID=UPI00379E9132
MTGPEGFAPQPMYAGPPPLRPDEERTWAIVSHLGGVLVSFVVPLVVWLVFKGRGPYLEDQAKEALNFQITVMIANLAGGVLTAVTLGFAFPVLGAIGIANLVLAILAAVASSRYEWYRYPLCLRLVH